MINIKTLIAGATLFSAGYYLHLFTHEKTSSYPSPKALNNYEASDLALSLCENKNLELTKYVNEFKKINNSVTNNVATSASPPVRQEIDFQTNEKNKIGAQDLRSQVTALNEYYVENEIKKQQEFLKSINASPENIPNALSDNYKKETIDNVWAPEKKALLDDYIANNNLLRSVPNVESDCRSTQCKISILSDDQAVLGSLGGNLMDLVNSNGFSEYKFTFDEKNHTTQIYLGRISKN